MDLQTILSHWTLPGPVTLRPVEAGGNNLTHFVDTPAETYFLRTYKNHTDPERVRSELALLDHLGQAGLPFDMPVPVRTATGDLMARVGGEMLVLTSALPGHLPNRENPEQIHAAGAALGMLNRAMAMLPERMARPVAGSLHGDLKAVHHKVPDPVEAVEGLPVDPAQKRQLGRLLDELAGRAGRLYQTLPRQVLHNDYVPQNVLMLGIRVSAVLDFEFAAVEVRPMDLAVGLGIWPYRAWGTSRQWRLVDAFGSGYLKEYPLTVPEREALPVLMQLRPVVGLIFHLGRHLDGLIALEKVVPWVEYVFQVQRWLAQYGQELVEKTHSWAEGAAPGQ